MYNIIYNICITGQGQCYPSLAKSISRMQLKKIGPPSKTSVLKAQQSRPLNSPPPSLPPE